MTKSKISKSSFLTLFILLVTIVVILASCSKNQQEIQRNAHLTFGQIEKLIRQGTPDIIVAGRVKQQGLAFKPSIITLEKLRLAGAGTKTLKMVDELIGFDFKFKEERLPDGYVIHPYSFNLNRENLKPPLKASIHSGTLPPGLILNSKTNSIEGEPIQKGIWKFTVKLSDAEGKRGKLPVKIKIYRKLTVGAEGILKGDDSIQMGINSAEDMDSICIESGTYQITGLMIIRNKYWKNGIKISGGWNSSFTKSSTVSTDTILEGGGKSGKNDYILIIKSKKGEIEIENFTFKNSRMGVILLDRRKTPYHSALKDKVIFSNCSFFDNLSEYISYAVQGGGKSNKIFKNCVFENNISAVEKGGIFKNCKFIKNRGIAVSGAGTFTDCSFTNNFNAPVGGGKLTNCTFEDNSGGVVSGGGTFTNCSFYRNKAGVYGATIFISYVSKFTNCMFDGNSDGVVSLSQAGTFIGCEFTNNYSRGSGGAVMSGVGNFINCKFLNNSASGSGGAVNISNSTFTNCLFINNSTKKFGGAIALVGGSYSSNFVINCTFYKNKADIEGGALYGNGKVLNSIFYGNKAGTKDIDITAKNLEIDYSLINNIKGPANFGPHNIKGNPNFVSPDSGDFSLQSNSPCINVGTIFSDINIIIDKWRGSKLEVKVPLKDLIGKDRILGKKIDMGAYEFQE